MQVRKRSRLTVVIGCALLIMAMAVTADADDWRQAGYGPGHAGANPNESALNLSNVVHVRRAFTVLVPDPVSSEVIVAGGFAYFAAGGLVYAVDARTGASLWSAGSCDGAAPQQPAFQAGRVWFGDAAGYLTGLDAATGMSSYCHGFGGSIFQVAVARGAVFVQDAAGDLVAVTARSGEILWERDGVLPRYERPTMPAVANGVAYAIARRSIVALDARTGSTIYDKPLPGSTLNAPIPAAPVATHGRVFVSVNGQIYALEASSAEVLWRSQADCCPTPPAVADGQVIIGTEDPEFGIFALSASTGHQVWEGSADELYTRPTIANGVVYECDEDSGEVDIYDAANGRYLSDRWPARGYCTLSPTVVNGMILQPAVYGPVWDDRGHGAVDAWMLPAADS